MITVLIGENTFEIERRLEGILRNFKGDTERVDGEELDIKRLPDLLLGVSLFATERLVIIKNVSAQKSLWSELERWLEKVSGDIHLVLIDEKPDKRTKTFKLLQKLAAIHEMKLWTERETLKAEQWVEEEAARLGFSLDKKSVQVLVEWAGLNQWTLYDALVKLAVLDSVTPEIIRRVVPAHPSENAFYLFETALKGGEKKVAAMLKTLELTEDPYRLFGLLSGQAFQLALLSSTNESDATVAADFGLHPFVVTKLRPFTKNRSRASIRAIVAAFAEADTAMKTSAEDTWLLIERALIKTAKTAL